MAKMGLKSSKKISTMKISKIKFNYGDGLIKIKIIESSGSNLQAVITLYLKKANPYIIAKFILNTSINRHRIKSHRTY
ncbi:MAG TPA: hypothetical protein DDY26_01140 [Moraxellaceae bacterium]|nr:hypothetical protein [Moraxellaceae bacterium]